MRVLTLVLAALQVISCLLLMVLVMLQKSKEGEGVSGNTVSSNSGMGMSRDNTLSRLTGIVGTVFVVLTIVVSTMMVVDLR